MDARADKNTVVTKIVEFVSNSLHPNDAGGYDRTLQEVFTAAWNDGDKQTIFKAKLDEWEVRLRETYTVRGDGERLALVPEGEVKEFYISPLLLSFDPAVSVKGVMPTCLCS